MMALSVMVEVTTVMALSVMVEVINGANESSLLSVNEKLTNDEDTLLSSEGLRLPFSFSFFLSLFLSLSFFLFFFLFLSFFLSFSLSLYFCLCLSFPFDFSYILISFSLYH